MQPAASPAWRHLCKNKGVLGGVEGEAELESLGPSFSWMCSGNPSPSGPLRPGALPRPSHPTEEHTLAAPSSAALTLPAPDAYWVHGGCSWGWEAKPSPGCPGWDGRDGARASPLSPADPQPGGALLYLTASLSALVCWRFFSAHLSNRSCRFQMEYLDTWAGAAGCSRQVFTLPQLSWEWERARPAAGKAVFSPRVSSGARQPVCPAHVSCRGQMCHLGSRSSSPACTGRGTAGAGCGRGMPHFPPSSPRSDAADAPNPRAKGATPAPSCSPRGPGAAPGTAQRPGCQRGCKAPASWRSQCKRDDTGCIVHENTWGRPRRTDSLAASGFLPPGCRLTSLLLVGMAAPAPLGP